MIFGYLELKECIRSDFNRFYREFGFFDTQIVPAILDEYKHGVDFDYLENLCIHIFLLVNYLENGLDLSIVLDPIRNLALEYSENKIMEELDGEYELYKKDIKLLRDNISGFVL